jgi:transposase
MGLRLEQGEKAQASASIIDSRFAMSTPESGAHSAYNGAKKKSGMKVHAVVDTLGHLLTLCVSAGNVDDRAPVEALCAQVQEVTGQNVEVMFADGGYSGEAAVDDAEWNAIELVVVKRPEASKGFVLLPKRWVVERSFAWVTRFRRLARDLERLPVVFAGLHWAVFGVLMLAKLMRGVVLPT